MELRKAVHGDVQQVRSRMLKAIPPRVVARVAQAKVRPKVDDRRAGRSQIGDDPRGRAVGEGQEDRVGLGKLGAHRQPRRFEMWMVAVDRLVVSISAGQTHDLHIRVARQEPDQFTAGIPGRPDDPDPDPSRHAIGRLASEGTRQEPRTHRRLARAGRKGRRHE